MFRLYKVMRVLAVLLAVGMGVLNQTVKANTLEGINHTHWELITLVLMATQGLMSLGPTKWGE